MDKEGSAPEIISEAAPRRPKVKRPIPRLKKWTVISVEWLDAVLHEGPQSSDNHFQGCTRKSVGHFLSRAEPSVAVAKKTAASQIHVRNGLCLPKRCVASLMPPVGSARIVWAREPPITYIPCGPLGLGTIAEVLFRQ